MGRGSPLNCGVKAKRNADKIPRIGFFTKSPKKKKVVSRNKKVPEVSGNPIL